MTSSSNGQFPITNYLIFLVSLFLILGSLEIIARILLPLPETVTFQNLSKIQGPSSPVNIITQTAPDAGLYYITPSGKRLFANVNALIKNHHLAKRDILLTTNAQGFRYSQLGKKDKKDFRILVLGDSITLGDSADQDKTYPAFIEKFLKEKIKDKNIQVINAGVGSIDLQNELAILGETGLSVKPDIVLVGLYLNDADESLAYLVTTSHLPAWVGKSRFLTFLFSKIDILKALTTYKKIQPEIKKQEQEKFKEENSQTQANKLIYSAFMDWGFAWSPLYWDKISSLLSEFKKLGEEHNFKLVVLLLPISFQVTSEIESTQPQQKFETLMTQMQIAHFDPLPALQEKYQKDKINIYFDQCHYREEGNEFLGGLLANFLAKQI